MRKCFSISFYGRFYNGNSNQTERRKKEQTVAVAVKTALHVTNWHGLLKKTGTTTNVYSLLSERHKHEN